MKIRLKKAFTTVIDGKEIKVGNEPVEVDVGTGQYLLDSFPSILELAEEKKTKGGKK
jgi:hypothetical protein